MGCDEDPYEATYPKANTEKIIGKYNPIKLKLPTILPAMAKLNWKDYYAGAALAGVLVVIGEDVVTKDKELKLEKNKVIYSPLIKEMVNSFRTYHRGYGDIVLQGNFDDEYLGVLEYAVKELGVESIEIKFGQAAKGIPTVEMESILYNMLKKLDDKAYNLPEIAVAGGISMEDHVFKTLALGANYIKMVGIGRASMAAAMVGEQVEDILNEGKVPKELQKFGSTKNEIFEDIKDLILYYENVEDISGGNVITYLNYSLKHTSNKIIKKWRKKLYERKNRNISTKG